MVDAEIAEGDVGAITQAIQNALLPAPRTTQRLLSHAKPAAAQELNGAEMPEPEIEVAEDGEDIAHAAKAPRQRASRRAHESPT